MGLEYVVSCLVFVAAQCAVFGQDASLPRGVKVMWELNKALMRRVLNHLKAQGARVLVVWTLEKSEAARRMYEGLGFKELIRMVHYSMDC